MIDDLYQEILDRKNQPKDGSYTNYLFDKGLDKILKKVGEESTEVIIAAKNNNEELVYESADLIYHLLVLLVNQGVSMADISTELASRQGKLSKTEDRKTIEEL
ncbi:phosphoribosyl-ATP diphosphatase [Enterococcus sp. LJL90]